MDLPDTTLEVDFGESVWLMDPLIVVCLVECNIWAAARMRLFWTWIKNFRCLSFSIASVADMEFLLPMSALTVLVSIMAGTAVPAIAEAIGRIGWNYQRFMNSSVIFFNEFFLFTISHLLRKYLLPVFFLHKDIDMQIQCKQEIRTSKVMEQPKSTPNFS